MKRFRGFLVNSALMLCLSNAALAAPGTENYTGPLVKVQCDLRDGTSASTLISLRYIREWRLYQGVADVIRTSREGVFASVYLQRIENRYLLRAANVLLDSDDLMGTWSSGNINLLGAELELTSTNSVGV